MPYGRKDRANTERLERGIRKRRDQPLQRETREKPISFSDGQYTDMIEEKIKSYAEKGGFDHLPGKGKPLDPESLKGDVLNSILKHNNVLPPWLDLQHKIRDAIGDLLEQMEGGKKLDLEGRIDQINEMISKYNNSAPGRTLQKNRINAENIKSRYNEWV
jgi:hypothetical protein